MEFFDRPLTSEEIKRLQEKWGNYLKITVDIEEEWLVAGGELHADGEKLLLDNGSKQESIWGGGVNLQDKLIDTMAVLNFRPRLNNDSLEILDPQTREEFVSVVKNYFRQLWG